MGSIVLTNISDGTSTVGSDIIHYVADNFTLLVGYFALVLPQPQIEILVGGIDYTVQPLNLTESKAYKLYDVRQSFAFLFGSRTSHTIRIYNGIRVPELFGCEMVVRHFELVSKSFNIE